MENNLPAGAERMLTAAQVAAIFKVGPHQVHQWAAAGRLSSVRTPGGRRRFLEDEVLALIAATRQERTP